MIKSQDNLYPQPKEKKKNQIKKEKKKKEKGSSFKNSEYAWKLSEQYWISKFGSPVYTQKLRYKNELANQIKPTNTTLECIENPYNEPFEPAKTEVKKMWELINC